MEYRKARTRRGCLAELVYGLLGGMLLMVMVFLIGGWLISWLA